ncbi:MAG: haloacid dehalogenase type II [Nocardioidaceae bacterium]|nr:haloacid dehalogenase type II [Nocardioidaceae bacterium]
MPRNEPVTDVSAVVLDVNETISDTRPMAAAFERVGAPAHLATLWFGCVLRDGFALTAAGSPGDFEELARGGLRVQLEPLLPSDDLDRSVDELMATFAGLGPHPDVAPGLRALAERGLVLVTLGNGPASTARTLLERANSDDVHETLSVDDAGAWKPAPQAYAYALSRLGTVPSSTVMVAVHPWDLDGAARAGLRTAWLNRDGRPWPAYLRAPDLEVDRLDALAPLLQVSGSSAPSGA